MENLNDIKYLHPKFFPHWNELLRQVQAANAEKKARQQGKKTKNEGEP